MDKTNITVTMPVEEYERLKNIEKDFKSLIRMMERANKDGKAEMTKELERYIEDIYC